MTSARAHSAILSPILSLTSPEATLDRVGGKGQSLARLAQAGLPVPPGFHIVTDAYRRFVAENHLADSILAAVSQAQSADPASLDRASEQFQSLIASATIPGDIAEAIRQAYCGLGADLPVAVRSSATAEDLPGISFAGQLETYLNVRGPDQVIDAVKRCWASLWTGRAIGYRQRQGIPSEELSMAVVVQQLVPADAAGVAFTANPVTGARDEIMINAAWGLGEAIVSGRVTPDSCVVNKQTGTIASSEIAAKDVMTVRLDSGTREEPVPPALRHQPALDPVQAVELARLCIRIEQLYGQPMDIEWALSNGRIFILQARPVTALPPERPALDWTTPRRGAKYMRTSVAEMLPEPLSPLFATLGLSQWTEATQQMMGEETMGMPREGIALLTINGYMYYEMALTSGQWARLLFTMLVRMRRLVRMLRDGPARWANEVLPRYQQAAEEWTARDLAATASLELLSGARRIVSAAAANYMAIQMILANVNMSEVIFNFVYNRLIHRKNDPPALTFLLGLDSAPIRAEKSLYDLALWARGEPELAGWLERATGKEIASAFQSRFAPVADSASWQEFTRRLADHLDRFGYAVYDLDFARSLPVDDPASVLETLKYFVAGKGRNPYERQAAASAAREAAAASVLGRLRGLRLRIFRRVLGWAQRVGPLREDTIASAGLGWPALRRILREAGRRMAATGAIAEPDDVFWLLWDELEEAARSLDAGEPLQNRAGAILDRRETWQSQHGAIPPAALPLKGGARIFGIDFARMLPARSHQASGNAIQGIGASPGKVSGPACVIQGPEEFDRMKPGDILIAKITTPAWTPLFALASGVVTDVGGPLSHSSIVAREYGIPAVLGTGVATGRIHTGQQISVDGDLGQVSLSA